MNEVHNKINENLTKLADRHLSLAIIEHQVFPLIYTVISNQVNGLLAEFHFKYFICSNKWADCSFVPATVMFVTMEDLA